MRKILGMSEEEFHQKFMEMLYPTLPYRSKPKEYDAIKDVNHELCSKCGGKCCKSCGCHFSPDDFKEISFEYLKKEMEKGYISIDYVDGEIIYESVGIYILRVRNQDAQIVDTGWKRSQCILLTEKGCKLDYEHRPTGGKLLIPSEEFNRRCDEITCRSKYSIKDCCYEWKPHQRILADLIEYFKEKEIPCSL